MKTGRKTTEFWGKSILQALLVIAAMFPALGFEIDEQTALTIAAGLEAIYTLGRSITKAFATKD